MSVSLKSLALRAPNVALAAGFVALMFALLAPVVRAGEKDQAKVSFLEGKATRTPAGGKPAPLAKDGAVFVNDTIETQAGTKVELKMQDGSAIRIGPASKLTLKDAYFGDDGKKTFSAKLLFGRVWSKVTGLVGESKFEVETDNAVAGVRGTTFRVDRNADKSVLVRVYAGSVAMAPGAALAAKGHQTPTKPGERKQVAGPGQITRAQWETLVGKMMQLSVNADGTPTTKDATAFTEKDDAGDEWAAWNQAMDEK